MKQVEATVLTAEDKKINKEFQKELAFIRDTTKEVDKLDTQIVISLIRIRDEKLYRGLYKTFEEACRSELRIEKSEWSRKLIAVETSEALKTSPKGEVLLKELDLNRAQILELANNTDDVESQLKVLQHISDNKLEPSAKVVKTVCDEILPPKTDDSEERAEAKRKAKEERQRLAEEARAKKQEEKRIADEKRKAEKQAAKDAKAEAKRNASEKPPEPTREPGDDEPDPAHAPPVAEVSISSESNPNDKAKNKIDDHTEQLGFDIKSIITSLEKWMVEVDTYHRSNPLGNHRAITASYRQMHNELTEASVTMIQVERGWKFSGK